MTQVCTWGPDRRYNTGEALFGGGESEVWCDRPELGFIYYDYHCVVPGCVTLVVVGLRPPFPDASRIPAGRSA